MKIYYAPEFARQVERASTRHQNMAKLIARYIENHTLSELMIHHIFRPVKVRDPDLYRISMHELRILASLKTDVSGQYWIFSQLEEHG